MTSFVISILLSFTTLQPANYFKYIDGNNNSYVVQNLNLSYTPVKMENSSSGDYDGGEEKTISLSSEQNVALENLFIEGINNLKCHIPNRNMGCGTIITSTKAGISTIYMAMKSKEKQELEKKLKALLRL